MTKHVAPANFLHDLWDQEVELEKEMLALGTERMQSRITKAREKHDMSNLRPHRSLLKEWVVPVSNAITLWIDGWSAPKGDPRARKGPRPLALPRLKELDEDTAAMVALRCVLRMLGLERRGILAIATEIGSWCEHEARCKAWQELERDGWQMTSRNFRDRGSNSIHQRRARITLFNKYVKDKIGWMDWTDEERQRVGLELLNIVIETTGRFHIIPDPDWQPKRLGRGKAFQKRPVVLEADPELLDWLASAMDDELVYAPAYLPTVIPPLDWVGPRDGGYHTPFVKTPLLIRFKANHQSQKNQAIEEYEHLDMPNVYRAINYVQGGAWQINTRVLEVANRVWDNDLAIAKIPRNEKEKVASLADGVEKGTEEYRRWAREAGETHSRNATRVSHYLSARRAILAAQRFAGFKEFYFPHKLDFRGRMYPIPQDLSPQGGDLHRGLLMAAERHAKPVQAEDAGWLAIHLANCYGVDKVDFDERMAWVEEREARWRSIAADPLEDRSWADPDMDDPWQALAAIFEWVRWLDEGPGMMSSLPIRVDGSCNGIQHLSAMVLDREGGEAVNLVPANKPQDIYQRVADTVSKRMARNSRDELSRLWMRVFGNRAPRSITKRPVMILPYGGTKYAYFKYTMDWIKKYDPHGEGIPKDRRAEAASYLVPILWKAVGDTVKRPKEVMDWLQANSIIASTEGLPLYWRTPVGFVVRQFYGTREARQIETRIDGQRIQLQDYRITPTLNKAEQAKGTPPNFTHSMDASALMECCLLCEENDIQFMTAIHDAYGTVAGDMWKMTGLLREAFIRTYREPVLANFQEACKDVARGDGLKWPKLPKMGTLDLEQIRHSEYFFA